MVLFLHKKTDHEKGAIPVEKLKQIIFIILIMFSSLCYAGKGDGVTEQLMKKNHVTKNMQKVVESLVQSINNQALLDMKEDSFNALLLKMADKNFSVSVIDNAVEIISLVYDVIDSNDKMTIRKLNNERIMYFSSMLKMDKESFWKNVINEQFGMKDKIKEIMAKNYINEEDKDIIFDFVKHDYSLFHNMPELKFKEMLNIYKSVSESKEKPQTIIAIYGLEDDVKNNRRIEYLLNNKVSLIDILTTGTTPIMFEKRIKSLIFKNLLSTSSIDKVKLIKDLMFLFDLKTDQKESLQKMLEGFELNNIINEMDWIAFHNVLENYQSDETGEELLLPELLVAEESSIQDIEEEEPAIFSGKSYEMNPRSNSAFHYNDYYSEPDDNSLRSKLEVYILRALERTLPGPKNELKRLNELNDFDLRTTLDYAEHAMEEMHMELFEEGKLLPHSIELLYDKEIRSRLSMILGIKGGLIGLCDYLRKLMVTGKGVWSEDKSDPDWVEFLNTFERSDCEKRTPASDGLTMLREITKKIKDGKTLQKIAKEEPGLVSDENIMSLLNEAKKTVNRNKEDLYMSQVSELIEVKLSSGAGVGKALQELYSRTQNYLDSGEKDRNILDQRLMESFNTDSSDIKKILNKLISKDGKLDKKGFVALFGTPERNSMDSLYHLMQNYQSDDELKMLFLFLNVLIIADKQFVDKSLPIAEYMEKFMSGESEWVKNGIKSSNNVVEEIAKKVGLDAKVIIERVDMIGKK